MAVAEGVSGATRGAAALGGPGRLGRALRPGPGVEVARGLQGWQRAGQWAAGSTALSPGGTDGTAQGSGGLSLEGRDHEPRMAPEVLNAVSPTEESKFELHLIVNRTALWLRC